MPSIAVARPFSHSMTALTELTSEDAPSSEQPVERAVPAMSTSTMA